MTLYRRHFSNVILAIPRICSKLPFFFFFTRKTRRLYYVPDNKFDFETLILHFFLFSLFCMVFLTISICNWIKVKTCNTLPLWGICIHTYLNIIIWNPQGRMYSTKPVVMIVFRFGGHSISNYIILIWPKRL